MLDLMNYEGGKIREGGVFQFKETGTSSF